MAKQVFDDKAAELAGSSGECDHGDRVVVGWRMRIQDERFQFWRVAIPEGGGTVFDLGYDCIPY
jgi:hypothetical protein